MLFLCAEKTKAEDWKLNLKERKSASKTLRERVPPVGASAETTMDESARGTPRVRREGGREVDHVYGGRREVDHVYGGREGGRWIMYTVGGRWIMYTVGGREGGGSCIRWEGGREVDHVYGGREGGGSCIRWEGGREVDHVYGGREAGRWIMYTVGGREVDHVYGGREVEARRRYVMERKSQIARCTSRRGKRPVGRTSCEGRAR